MMPNVAVSSFMGLLDQSKKTLSKSAALVLEYPRWKRFYKSNLADKCWDELSGK